MEPFDTLRDQLPNWTLAITALEGVMGLCDTKRRTIWVDVNLSDRERRSTIMHEIVHAIRGDATDDPESEAAVQIETAQRLIPTAALTAVLATTSHPEDMCDALDVDIDVLRTRIRSLDSDEISQVRKALAPHTHRYGPSDHCALGRWWLHHRHPAPAPNCGCITTVV